MSNLNNVKKRIIMLSPTVEAGIERECNINDFDNLGILGEGGFAQVLKAQHKQSKKIYAIKKVSKQKLRHKTLIDQMNIEIKIMYSLNHENIVKLFNHFEDNEAIYLIIECAEGGQLYTKLRHKGRFNEKIAQQYTAEMVSAIDYCHSRNPPIIHRDIKPENILLDKQGHVKLADFGWSNFMNPDEIRKTYAGTVDYLAPEMIDDQGHGLALDYWCLGVLVFELLTGKAPFAAPPGVQDERQANQIVFQNVAKGIVDYPKDFPPLAKDLVNKLLKKDPEQRLKIDEIKKHPWISPMLTKREPSIQSYTLKSYVPKESIQSHQSSTIPKDTEKDKLNSLLNTTQAEESKAKENLESIKDIDLTWTTEELQEFTSKRPDSIMHTGNFKEPESPINTNLTMDTSQEIKTNESKDLFKRFSVSYNNKAIGNEDIIEELNRTIKELKNENSELEVKLKLGQREVEDLKKENEKLRGTLATNFDSSSPEGKRVLMLEEERKRLKQEIDDIWLKVESQETQLQKNNLELKKFVETKALAEKYKGDKSSLSKQLKEIQEKYKQVQTKILELEVEREEERQKYDKILKDKNFSRGPDSLAANEQEQLKSLVSFAKTSMEEMQKKIDHYREKSENIEKLKQELDERKIRIFKLEADLQEKISETKRILEEQYESEKSEMEKAHKAEIGKIENRYKDLIKKLENEIDGLKNLQFDKNELEAAIESYKNEIKSLKTKTETMNETCLHLQTLKDRDEKRIKHLLIEIEDLKIRIDLAKASYQKSK